MNPTFKEINGLHIVEGDLSGSSLYNPDSAPNIPGVLRVWWIHDRDGEVED